LSAWLLGCAGLRLGLRVRARRMASEFELKAQRCEEMLAPPQPGDGDAATAIATADATACGRLLGLGPAGMGYPLGAIGWPCRL